MKKSLEILCLFYEGKLSQRQIICQGFNYEDTHFTIQKLIDNLTKLLALACAIALLLGIIRAVSNPIVIKKHGYKQHSYFRYGLDLIIS